MNKIYLKLEFIVVIILIKAFDMPKQEMGELFEDDGLATLDVGHWAIRKHEKIGYYCSLFATSMKNKWDSRVYLDLFAGSGKCYISNKDQIIPGSPLLALNVEDPFDLYIFCEKSEDFISVLRERVTKYFPDRICKFVCGDINLCLDSLFNIMPTFSFQHKGLTFCFVDPFKAGQLNFDTIRSIQEKIYVDFLVLIPSFMDINRNEQNYTRVDDHSLDLYLGTDTWRERWKSPQRPRISFGVFIVQEFCLQMKELGYLYEGLSDLELIRGDNNQPLYHLSFFSKHPLGLKFWRETVMNTEPQLSLWPRGEF